MVGDSRILRTMTAADASAVARIGFAAWAEHRFYPEWRDIALEQRVVASFRKFAEEPQADVVVCAIDGAVVGWGARDSRDHAGDRTRPWDYISDLWIDPAWQGRGIGSAIVAEQLGRMRRDGIAIAAIEAVEANEKALGLYRHLGFAEIWRGELVSETLGIPVRRVLLQRPTARTADETGSGSRRPGDAGVGA